MQFLYYHRGRPVLSHKQKKFNSNNNVVFIPINDIEAAAEHLRACLTDSGINILDWTTNGNNVFIFDLDVDNAFDLDFDDYNVFGEKLTEAKAVLTKEEGMELLNAVRITGTPPDEKGRVYYDVKLTDGTVRMNRYCDCGKDIIDKQMTNIWFRKK